MSTIDELVAQVGTLQQSTNALLQAVLAKGSVKGTYASKAAAVATLPTLAEGERVWVLVDESVPGTTAWYVKSGGALVAVARQYLQSGIDDALNLRVKRGGPLNRKAEIDSAYNGVFRVDEVPQQYLDQGLYHYGTLVGLFGTGSDTCSQWYYNYADQGVFFRSGQTAVLPTLPWRRSSNDEFRTARGAFNTGGSSLHWFAIGRINMAAQSDYSRITVLGTGGYGKGEGCSGETVIHLRRNNSATPDGAISGHFYGHSGGNATVLGVALQPLAEGSMFRVFVKSVAYASIACLCDTPREFFPESSDVGAALPAGAVEIPSEWRLNQAGTPAMLVDAQGTKIVKGGFQQGPLAPITAKKTITGHLPASQGDGFIAYLGIDAGKVVGIQAFAVPPSQENLRIPPGFLQVSVPEAPNQYLYSLYWRRDDNTLRGQVGPASTSIFGAFVGCQIEYVVD